MAAAAPYVTITAEHFFGPLGLAEPPQGTLPQRRRELFVALVELLDERGLVVRESAQPADRPLREVDLRVPGTPIHVHLGAVGDTEIQEAIAIASGLGLLHQGGEVILTFAGLKKLLGLFSRLKTQYGERSVIEALRDARPPTADGVAGVLHGAACRHPNADCRYNESGLCAITASVVEDTLTSLAARGVVVARNAVAPIEYGVTF